VGVSNPLGQLDCLGEVGSDFVRGMGIRTKRQCDAHLLSHLQEIGTGIHFLTFLAQTGCVDFDGNIVLPGGGQ
jgi:hypothetical protein